MANKVIIIDKGLSIYLVPNQNDGGCSFSPPLPDPNRSMLLMWVILHKKFEREILKFSSEDDLGLLEKNTYYFQSVLKGIVINKLLWS